MTREEAIKIFNTVLFFGKCDCPKEEIEECLNMAIKALDQEPKWIPVSEKYPKPEDEYKHFLVTDDKDKVSIQEFYMSLDKEPQPYFSGMVNVIAWMPLPEPYKAANNLPLFDCEDVIHGDFMGVMDKE